MTDQTIPADKVRDIIARYRTAANGRGSILLDELEALLPKRPTLADMAQEERDACQWMQCDVAGVRGRWALVTPSDEDGDAGLVAPYGDICWFLPERVTPRPDLPRLEWPGEQQPAPAPALPDGWQLADHKERGRVIVTNDTPNAAGDVCYVLPADDPLGYDWLFCDPSELTYLDKEADQ